MAAAGGADRRIYRASTTAPVNIAIIKYWGKRDAKLNLPTNSSLSVTLSQSDLRAFTTASCSATFPPEDTLHLDTLPQDISNPRTQACLRELRALRRYLEEQDPTLAPVSTYPLRLVSTNNFPTAAGLASSAAGFAALVQAIANLYELPATIEALSRIARQGSGSACRSLFGGYVAWEAGVRADGSDSMAIPLHPAGHWPTIRALILVISAAKKDVSSTAGMQATVATSSLFATRANDVVPHRMQQMEAAITEKDFSTFGLLMMRDSNSFHACCADTYPPIFYMTDASRAAIRFVEQINEQAKEIVCAYTFDAGPNCVVFYEQKNAGQVEGCFKAVVGQVPGWGEQSPGQAVSPSVNFKAEEKVASQLKNGVSRVIMTGVGEGPIAMDQHLIDEQGKTVVQ